MHPRPTRHRSDTRTSVWNVAIDAHYGDAPLGPWQYTDAQMAALEHRVLVHFGAERCTARFQVVADELSEATSIAISRWTCVARHVEIPPWRMTHLRLDLAADSTADALDRVIGDLDEPSQRHLAVVRSDGREVDAPSKPQFRS